MIYLASAACLLAACGPVVQQDAGMSEESASAAGSSAAPDATPSLELATPRPQKSSPASSATPVGSDSTVFPAGEIDPSLAGLADVAVDDLAQRLGVSGDSIAVVTATLVTWPDASLGCPAPGMRYKQVPSDGAVIELEESDRIYRYHTGGSGRSPFLCDQPLAPVPSATGR